MFDFLKKKKKSALQDDFFHQALQPVSLHPEVIEKLVKSTVTSYIKALHSQDVSLLPKEHMDRGLYEEAVKIIENDTGAKRTCEQVNILHYRTMFSDLEGVYKTTYLSFEITTQMLGTFNEKEVEYQQSKCYGFLNDQRLGWILTKVGDLE